MGLAYQLIRGVTVPKSLLRKLKAVGHCLNSDDSLKMSIAKEDGRELEEQAEKYYKRNYGAKNVETQVKSNTSGCIRDLVVKKPKPKD
jgi:hypothetical protein